MEQRKIGAEIRCGIGDLDHIALPLGVGLRLQLHRRDIKDVDHLSHVFLPDLIRDAGNRDPRPYRLPHGCFFNDILPGRKVDIIGSRDIILVTHIFR